MRESSVTIITAAYNAVPFLTRYASGIRAQGQVCIEIIMVDDGSDDGTRETLLSLSRDRLFGSAKCRILSQPNQGPHVAMNYGLKFASGDLILPVDADDMLLPGAVQAFVDAFSRYPDADLVFADYRQIDEQERIHPLRASRREWVRSANLLYDLLAWGMFIPAGAYCYHRRCLEYLPDGCFSRAYQAQNLELLLHTAARGKCVYTPVETVQLTMRSQSRSRAASLERLRRKVEGSHCLQRHVARLYRVPFGVRLRLERRLIPLEMDYFFLCGMRKAFIVTWLKALCLRVGTRRNFAQVLSFAIPRLRSWVITRYFKGYDLGRIAC